MTPTFGLMEALLLVLSGGGGTTHDLVSLIPTKDYFQSRSLKVDVETMRKLAEVKKKLTASDQIRQLLAIRWLGENPKAVQATDRKLLARLAKGEQQDDPHGFARFYAQRALAKLEKKPIPVQKVTKGETATQSTKVLPKWADVVVAVDLRSRTGQQAEDAVPLRPAVAMIATLMTTKQKSSWYDTVEKLGNVRIDRIAVGLEWVNSRNRLADRKLNRIACRVFGAWKSEWVVDAVNPAAGQYLKSKDEDGGALQVLALPSVSAGLIGEGEIIFGMKNNAEHLKILQEMLDVRSELSEGLNSTALGKMIQGSPKDAQIVLSMKMDDNLKQEMKKELGLVAPRDLLLYGLHGKGLTLHGLGIFSDEKESQAFSKALQSYKADGLKTLSNPPDALQLLPKGLVKELKTTLSSSVVSVKSKQVQVKLSISNRAVQALMDLIAGMEGGGSTESLPELKPRK